MLDPLMLYIQHNEPSQLNHDGHEKKQQYLDHCLDNKERDLRIINNIVI